MNYIVNNYKCSNESSTTVHNSIGDNFQSPLLDVDFYVRGDEDDNTDNYSIVDCVNNTDCTNDIQKANRKSFDYFMYETPSFKCKLLRTDFEDGMTNEAVEQVKSFYKLNSFVTLNWLSYMFSNNLNDYRIISRLLRIFSNLPKDSSSFLLPMVIAGLNNKNSVVQEAAIMVIEEWRTPQCLDALMNTTYTSIWVKDYADIVITELESEFNSYAN